MSGNLEAARVLGQAIEKLANQFCSPNVADSNLEPANIVDVLAGLAKAINRLATAIEQDRHAKERRRRGLDDD